MAGGDKLGVESRGALSERRELQVTVAMDAGNGRPAAGVLVHEIRDHLIGELALEVDDVVRDADAGGDTPRVVQVVDGTAGAESRRLTAGALRLVIELHREPDDLVALPGEQRGGD